MQSLQTKAAYSGKSKGVSRGTVGRSLTRPFLGRGSCWRPGAHSKLQFLPGISQPGSMGFPHVGQFIGALPSPAALKRHSYNISYSNSTSYSNSISNIYIYIYSYSYSYSYIYSFAALIAQKRTTKGGKPLRGEEKQKRPVSAKRQRRKPLRYHSFCRRGWTPATQKLPGNGGVRGGLLQVQPPAPR